MATFVCASGRNGSVLVGTITYNFKDWSLSMEEKLPEVSNFGSGGYRVYCRGLDSATLDLSGAYDVGPSGSGGNMALTLGTSYSFTLNVNSTVSYIVTAICNKINITQNVDEAAMIKVTATINGSFTASST